MEFLKAVKVKMVFKNLREMSAEKLAVLNERFVAQDEGKCACSSGFVIHRRKRDLSGKSCVIN